MKDDDIEILDFDEEIIYSKKKVLVNDEVVNKSSLPKNGITEIKSKASDKKSEVISDKKKISTKKNKKRKYTVFEKLFLAISAFFIVGCFIFYGYRTYHYYHLTHDIVKNITLKDKLTSLNNITYQNDGLYEKSGYFYYKGVNVNNYVYYSGRLFRIIDIDENIRMIEEKNETNLVWGVDSIYENSNIKKWLDDYLNTLKDYDIYLVKNKWCNSQIEVQNYECKDALEDYVGLISISDYLQAGAKNSYLNNESYFWTINQDIDGHSIYINSEGNINNLYRKENSFFSYGVRPVITMKGDISIVSGDGTYDNPYIVEELGNAMLRDNSIGSYVTYNDENYRILSIDDSGISLIYDGVIDVNKKFDSVYDYLNKDFIKKLNKADLVKNNYEVSVYNFNNKYSLNSKKTKSNYVIIPSIGDLFLCDYNGYWLSNYSDSKLGLYYTIDENNMYFADLKGNSHQIRPIIKLNTEIVVSSGTGTETDPLVIDKEGDKDAKEN